jgi:hypothetical protein
VFFVLHAVFGFAACKGKDCISRIDCFVHLFVFSFLFTQLFV